MIKKIICCFLSCIMIFCFTSCGKCKEDEHSYEYSVTKEATCEENGISKAICTTCGYETEQIIEKIEHNYFTVQSTEATCSSEGFSLLACEYCGKTNREELPKKEHQFPEITSCLSSKVCLLCMEKVGEVTGHNYENSSFCAYCKTYPDMQFSNMPKTPITLKLWGGHNVRIDEFECFFFKSKMYVNIAGVRLASNQDSSQGNAKAELSIGFSFYDSKGDIIGTASIDTEKIGVGEEFKYLSTGPFVVDFMTKSSPFRVKLDSF